MPKPDLERDLVKAAVEILRPIVRQMIATGVVFGHLESRLRELFVRVAESKFSIPDRPQTDSRISVLTGINRKEVRRIRATHPKDVKPTSFQRNLAADLVSRWTNDPDLNEGGHPRKIPFRSKAGPSFVRLVRETTSDLRPRAILDELLRTGMVELADKRHVALRAEAYIPRSGDAEKLAMLAEDPSEMIQTMLHNVFSSEQGELWLQQKVSYDNLGHNATERVRTELRGRSERFLRGIDRLLARYDRDRNPKAPGGDRRYAGLGVYYFESSDEERSGAPGSPGSRGNDDGVTKDSAPPAGTTPRGRRVRRRP